MFHFSCKLIVPVAALLFSAAWLPLHAQTTTAGVVTVTVTSSANPSTFAAPLTFNVAVAAPTSAGPVPTGTVSATLLGPILLGAATLDGNGKGSITIPVGAALYLPAPFSLPAGSNSITFTYSGDKTYTSAQSTFSQFVNKADTTTTAGVSGSAQPMHLTATVKIDEPVVVTGDFSLPGNLSSSAPSGSVQFFNGTTLLGTATLVPEGLFTATAVLSTVIVPASLTAIYQGDTNYNGSTSPTVGGGGTGTANLTISSSVNPATFAQPVTFMIAVAPANSGGVTPTGKVSASLLGLFNLGIVTLDSSGHGSLTVPMSSAAVTSTPWGLPAGSYSITFSYSGDANYSGAQTAFTQTVDKAATTTAATVSPSDTSITATVSISEPSVSSLAFVLPGPSGQASNPSGTVQFMNGATVIGTASLSPSGRFQSVATFNMQKPFPSSADLIAVYGGDANYNGSTSPAATVPTLAAVTVGVTSNVNAATFAEPVTFSIKVTPATAGNAIPTGTVRATLFGSDLLGGAILDSTGSATITVPPQSPSGVPALLTGLATGANSVTVTYSGDSTFAPGQSTFNQLVKQADTVTTVALDPVPTPTNTSVYLATVNINEPSVSKTGFRLPAGGNLSTSPTGNVDFFDGATLLGTVKLTPGSLFQSTATFTASPIPSSIRAVYYGDTDYNGSSSPSTGLGNGQVTITLTSSANPTTYGAPFTILAIVTPQTTGGPTPTGSLQFFDGSKNLGWTATLDSSGKGTLPIPVPLATPLVCLLTCPPAANVMVLGAGTNIITAQYSGDVNYASATSASSVAEQITKAPTNTTISEFAEVFGLPSVSGIVATVADSQAPAGGPYHFLVMSSTGLVDGNPTGNVQFHGGTTQIGTASLTPNSSANVTSTAGIDNTNDGPNFLATYVGDANFQGSSSSLGAATSVSLTASPNPSTTGQSVTLTATVSSASTTPALTGKVNFLDGTTLLGSATISGGAATLTATFNTAGSHSLTAKYSGDANYQASTSAAYTQVVNGSTIPTDTLKLTVSASTAVFGQHVVLFAQLSGNVSTPPTGTVTFLDASTILGTGTFSQSSAHIVVTLAVGLHQISASWPGDSNWPAAQSVVVKVTVNRAATVTTLTNFGTVWTVEVIALPPGEGTPTGSVLFVDTVTQAVLATANLSAGSATVTLSSVANPVEAVYSGDTNFQASTSRNSSTRPPKTHR